MPREVRPWPDLLPAVGILTYLSRRDSDPEGVSTNPANAHFYGWHMVMSTVGINMLYDIGNELAKYARNLF